MRVIPEKKALVLKLRDTDRVTTLIPKSKVLKPHIVAVKHGVDEVKVLRNIGLDAPSPLGFYYKWPGMYTPFHAQRATAEFLCWHNRAFVLNGLGSGKSMATLWAYDFLRQSKVVNKLLVISPLSTLERTWADEVFKHFPHLSFAVLHGSREKRLKLLAQTDVDVYIVNHDGVEIIKDALKNRADINLVVVDEIAQVARNSSANRWKALNVVINRQTPRMAWGLTGTPTPNAPTDAWAQCRLLVPESVPPYFNRFKDAVMKQMGPFLWVPRPNAAEVVQQVMQPAIRFSREECVDLPPVMFETRSVGLSPEQESAYKQMMTRLSVEYDEGQILAVNEAVKMSKLLQICTGGAYDTSGNEVAIPAPARFAEVHNIIEEAGSKVIVFTPFVASVGRLVEYLTSKHVSVECIHGGVSKTERDRVFSAFQKSNEPRVIVAQPAAMSHGLTLTAASTIVWFAPITSNETFEQACGRITRPGQKLNQFVIMLEGSPVERKLYERLKNKQKAQGLLLSLMKENR